MTAELVAMHLGKLHAYEQALVWLVAFGPFVVLAVVVHRARKRDIAAEQTGESGETERTGEAGCEASSPAPQGP